jgi:hypothetical protein
MLQKVSHQQFFSDIYTNNLDVHPTIVTRFPYTSEWKFHRRLGQPLYGKTVETVKGGRSISL